MDLVDSPNATAQASLKTGLGIGTLANSGGTATLGGILGDVANSSIAARLTALANYVDTLETSVGTLANTGGTATLAAILGDPANESLAYRIMEIERHLHGWERWLGKHGTPSGEVTIAQQIGSTTVTPFQIDAGNNTWGSWVQILGSSDTPVTAAQAKFDLHKVTVTAAERATAIYFIQLAFGASGAAALTAGTYTEFVYWSPSAVSREAPISIMARRQDAGTKTWARCWCVGQNTATLDFFFGLHEYAA